VLFPTLFTIIVLRNSRGLLQFISLGLIAVGIVLVMVAAYEHGKDYPADGQRGKNSALGAVLALGGHCITSAVPALEDWFFGGTSTETTLIVGLEGLFAVIVAGPIFLPIASTVKGADGSGISENIADAADMLKKSPSILVSVLGLIGLGTLQGTARAFINAAATENGLAIALIVQTVAVWVIQLVMKAALGRGTYGEKHPYVGEELTKWSALELVGFLLAAVGVMVNANVFRLKKGVSSSSLNETPLISS
jgi:hypothetical protein